MRLQKGYEVCEAWPSNFRNIFWGPVGQPRSCSNRGARLVQTIHYRLATILIWVSAAAGQVVVGPSGLVHSQGCVSWNSASLGTYTKCFLGSDHLIESGQVLLPDRFILEGPGNFNCGPGSWVGSDTGWVCESPPDVTGSPSPSTAPPAATPAPGTPSPDAGLSDAVTLDLASLSQLFTVPADGRLALRGLRITGALLPPSAAGVSKIESFLALSAFVFTGTGSDDGGETLSDGPPCLVLSDLVISTPDCEALSQHQTTACDLSPSPNFTVSAGALTVHRFTTPLASITNVVLQCSGPPAALPCLASQVANGRDLIAQVQALEGVAQDSASLFDGAQPRALIYLEDDVALPGPGDDMPDFPLSLARSVVVLSGRPDGTTVMDLADIVSVFTVEEPASFQLHNLTLRRAPSGLAGVQRIGLLRLFLWTFNFRRSAFGSRGGNSPVLLVRGCAIELPRAELALWFSDFLGRESVPAALRGALCAADIGLSGLAGVQVTAGNTTCPSLLVEQMKLFGQKMVLEDILLTAAEDSNWCGSGSSSSDAGTDSTLQAAPATSPGSDTSATNAPAAGLRPAASGQQAVARTASRGSSSAGILTQQCADRDPLQARQPLCLLIPEGLCGTVVSISDTALLNSPSSPWEFASRVWPPSDGLYIWLPIASDPLDTTRSPLVTSVQFQSEPVPSEPWRQGPAVVTVPAAFLGSPLQLTVLDLGLLQSAFVFNSSNASVTLRYTILANLPPAGSFPVPVDTAFLPDPPPPGGPPPFAPPWGPPWSPLLPPAQPTRRLLRSTCDRSRVLSTVSTDEGESRWAPGTTGDDPWAAQQLRGAADSTAEAAARLGGYQPMPLSGSWRRRQQQRLLTGSGDGLGGPALGALEVTQGLSPALTNFTSCVWTLSFDREASTAQAAAALAAPSPGLSDAGAAATSSPPVDGVAAAGTPSPPGSSERPVGLPYVFLDSVVLLVPQPELDLMAAAWLQALRGGDPSTLTSDPGLAEQLALMWAASRLTETSAAALSAAASGKGDPAAEGSQVPGPAPGLNATTVTSLSFDQLWWCGLEGRNVTWTSVLPDLGPESTLVIQPQQLDLPPFRVRRTAEPEIAPPTPQLTSEPPSQLLTPPPPPPQALTLGPLSADPSASSSSHSAMVGGVIGGVAGACLVLAVAYLARRRRMAPPAASATVPAASPEAAKQEPLCTAQQQQPGSGPASRANSTTRTATAKSGSSLQWPVTNTSHDNRQRPSDDSSVGGPNLSARQQEQQQLTLLYDHLQRQKDLVASHSLDSALKRCSGTGATDLLATPASACGPSGAPPPCLPVTQGTQPAGHDEGSKEGKLSGPLSSSPSAQPTKCTDVLGVVPVDSEGYRHSLLTICGELGRGAQGVVYRGVWRGLDVAVKSLLLQVPHVPSASSASDDSAPSSTDRAIQEAAISASVSHPNLVATYTYMLTRLGEDGRHEAAAAQAQGQASGATTPAPSSHASRSTKGSAEPEVWKLTLVQELCDANSLRHCLEQGTLAACAPRWAGQEAQPHQPRSPAWARTFGKHLFVVPGGFEDARGAETATCGVGAAQPTTVAGGEQAAGASACGPVDEAQSAHPPAATTSTAAAAAAPVLAAVEPAAAVAAETPQQQQAGQQPAPQQPSACYPQVTLMVALHIARGLAHLHSRGIVHADVSSANVLLKSEQGPGRSAAGAEVGAREPFSYGYVAKLCDFGLSGRLKWVDDTHLSGPARRSSAYSAPELVRLGRSGPAGDVYALAVVLWELAQGAPLPALLSRPEGARVQAWLVQQSMMDPSEAGALPPGLLGWPPGTPAGLIALVGECLREEPGMRPPTQQVCGTLGQLLRM